jgi:hypothetical protein
MTQAAQPLPTGPSFRIGYAAVAGALGAGLAAALTQSSSGGWHALVFGLAPDLALLFAAGRGLAKGQLHPRAVPLYNGLHSLVGPIALGTIAALGLFGLDVVWLVAALAWAAHIATDRAFAFGHRTPEGFLEIARA